jgi:SH3-like domain-containing protein
MIARNNAMLSAVHAVTGGYRFRTLSLSVVLTLCSVAVAQVDVNLPGRPNGLAPSTETAAPAPITAEVTGNDVNTRSGPGTNFYTCGKLYRGDRVQVARSADGWSAIVPPKGSYSWVAVQYVSISTQNPTQGVVTGNGVPVYAGSDEVEPLVSTTKQDVTLTRGQPVTLLGEAKDEYYKIAPPEGAYLWVSSQYLSAQAGQGGKVPLPTTTEGRTVKEIQLPSTQVTANDANLISTFYALKAKFDEELKKPLAQQDFTAIKAKLKTLADNKEGGRAARYAQITLDRVNRAELAQLATKELDLQNKDLKETSAKIDEALQEQLKKIQDSGSKYTVIGKLQPSALYAAAVGQTQRYQLLDDSGRIICYVAPAGLAATKDLSSFIGHKVGLVGQVQPHQATSRAFVEFSDIVRLD